MNALKHMELIFGAAVLAACAFAALPERQQAPVQAQATTPAMPVVVIKARRMSAEEKRASLVAGGARPETTGG